jgi:hypothetical protein
LRIDLERDRRNEVAAGAEAIGTRSGCVDADRL